MEYKIKPVRIVQTGIMIRNTMGIAQRRLTLKLQVRVEEESQFQRMGRSWRMEHVGAKAVLRMQIRLSRDRDRHQYKLLFLNYLSSLSLQNSFLAYIEYTIISTNANNLSRFLSIKDSLKLPQYTFILYLELISSLSILQLQTQQSNTNLNQSTTRSSPNQIQKYKTLNSNNNSLKSVFNIIYLNSQNDTYFFTNEPFIQQYYISTFCYFLLVNTTNPFSVQFYTINTSVWRCSCIWVKFVSQMQVQSRLSPRSQMLRSSCWSTQQLKQFVRDFTWGQWLFDDLCKVDMDRIMRDRMIISFMGDTMPLELMISPIYYYCRCLANTLYLLSKAFFFSSKFCLLTPPLSNIITLLIITHYTKDTKISKLKSVTKNKINPKNKITPTTTMIKNNQQHITKEINIKLIQFLPMNEVFRGLADELKQGYAITVKGVCLQVQNDYYNVDITMKSNGIDKGQFVTNTAGKLTEKYKIFKELGRGISGVVFLAGEKLSNNKNFKAIKRVEKRGGLKLEDIMNQLAILKELDHPDIIRLYQWYEDQNFLYFVTDFCEGGELFDYLEKKCHLSEEEARSIFNQMLGAVKYCHSKKIAHRDLKPQNFLLLKKAVPGQPINLKLIDFGLAIRWHQSLEKQLLAQGKKKIVGTAYYISPQVIKGVYDEKCDIWSIGVILYILVTGVPPFDGQTDKQILKSIQKNKISFTIPQMNNVSLLLKDLLKKMLKPASQRITIEEIYRHPWMTIKVNKAPISIDFKPIANFSKFSKIKTIAATYLASQMTAMQTQNLQKLFKLLDENCDGYLSLEQLNKYLNSNQTTINKSTINYLRGLLQMIDTPGGKINYTQFLASTITEQALTAKQNLQKVFSMMDKDGNGFIDRDQLFVILSKHGYLNKDNLEKQMEQIFQSTDANKDGKIDFGQFAAVVTKVVE